MDAVDPTPRFERFKDYEQACREFRWLIPQRLNIASVICRRHPDAVTRIALSEVKEGGINTYTFGGLDFLSDKFAASLTESGIIPGDRIAVMLPPSAALAVAQLGALKTGAMVIPLSKVSDVGFLEHALADSSAKAVIVDESSYGIVEKAARNLRNLALRLAVRDLRDTGTSTTDFKDFWDAINKASSDFEALKGPANSSAFVFYPESQGDSTGVIHSHRSIIGQFAAFEMFNNVESDSVFWTPDDWATPAATLGVLYPALWYGCSLVGAPEEVDSVPRLLEQCEVTHAFFPAHRPKGFEQIDRHTGELSNLRTIVVETVSPQHNRQHRNPTLVLNEVHGTPETGWMFGSCNRWFATPAGSAGRPVPGRSVEIIDENGKVLPARCQGHVAVHKSDPALFTGYYQSAARTAAAFIGDWFLTGYSGYKSAEGEFYIPTVSGDTERHQPPKIDNGC